MFQGTKAGIHAQIKVHDWHLCKLCLTKGDIGLAEAYIDGLWDSDDIDQLLRLFLANRHVIEKAIYGSLLGKTIARIKHWQIQVRH